MAKLSLPIEDPAASPASAMIDRSNIDRSNIEWTGATWNPWQGCRKVSEACKFCYMYRDMPRFGKDPEHIHRSADATFNRPLKWQREVEQGFRQGRDRLVFACSWSDWFIEEADAWRDEAWAMIRRCPGLIFQLLTKRAYRILDCLPDFWWEISDRVWLGATVENQQRAEERMPHLAELRRLGIVTFASYEPALGPVKWKQWPEAIGWLIAGGESGPKARPSHPDWFREARDFCEDWDRFFFFKQWGEWLPISEMKDTGALYRSNRIAKNYENQDAIDEAYGRHCIVKTTAITFDGSVGWGFPSVDGRLTYQTFRVGREKAGRLLDGVEYSEFPCGIK